MQSFWHHKEPKYFYFLSLEPVQALPKTNTISQWLWWLLYPADQFWCCISPLITNISLTFIISLGRAGIFVNINISKYKNQFVYKVRGNLTTQNTQTVFNQSCVFFLHCNLADRKGQYWKWVPFIQSLFWVFSSIRDQNFCQLSSTENKSFVTFSVNKVSSHKTEYGSGSAGSRGGCAPSLLVMLMFLYQC